MKYMVHAFFFCLLLGLGTAAHATTDMPHDSYYFMLDDGKMSPKEMDEEAVVVFDSCQSNLYQKKYFNCECIAGKFRQIREKDGPMRPQEDIVYALFHKEASSECVNPADIAGTVYKDCQHYTKIFRERARDNEAYCSCVGRTVTKRFSKSPYLDLDYIAKLNENAMLDCQNRDEKENPLPREK